MCGVNSVDGGGGMIDYFIVAGIGMVLIVLCFGMMELGMWVMDYILGEEE